MFFIRLRKIDMSAIFFKELNSFLHSLIGCVVIGVFLLASGLLLWVFPETSVLEYGFADLGAFFAFTPYIFIFLIPAITMKSFAEEKKMGTMELLFAAPVTEWEIVAGKYLAALSLTACALLPTAVYYFSLRCLSDPAGNVDTAAVTGSYLGLMLLASVFCAIGLMASSLVSHQIAAFLIGAFLCFIFYAGFDSLSTVGGLFLQQLGMIYHFETLGKGLIDSRDVLYFLSFTGIALVIAKTILSSRKW